MTPDGTELFDDERVRHGRVLGPGAVGARVHRQVERAVADAVRPAPDALRRLEDADVGSGVRPRLDQPPRGVETAGAGPDHRERAIRLVCAVLGPRRKIIRAVRRVGHLGEARGASAGVVGARRAAHGPRDEPRRFGLARAGPAFVVVFLGPRRDHRHEHDPDDERHGQGPGDAPAQPRRGRGFMRRPVVHTLHVSDAVLGGLHGEAAAVQIAVLLPRKAAGDSANGRSHTVFEVEAADEHAEETSPTAADPCISRA